MTRSTDITADERARLIALIEQSGVPKYQIAWGIGIGPALLSEMLSGRRTLTPSRAAAIRRAVESLRGEASG